MSALTIISVVDDLITLYLQEVRQVCTYHSSKVTVVTIENSNLNFAGTIRTKTSQTVMVVTVEA